MTDQPERVMTSDPPSALDAPRMKKRMSGYVNDRTLGPKMLVFPHLPLVLLRPTLAPAERRQPGSTQLFRVTAGTTHAAVAQDQAGHLRTHPRCRL